jgi:hypothetical protein
VAIAQSETVHHDINAKIENLDIRLTNHEKTDLEKYGRLEALIDRMYWAIASTGLLILSHFVGFILWKLGIKKL